MTAATKIANIEKQIDQIASGKKSVLICPYCNKKNQVGCEAFCCITLAGAVDAILDRRAKAELLKHADRIAEAAVKEMMTPRVTM